MGTSSVGLFGVLFNQLGASSPNRNCVIRMRSEFKWPPKCQIAFGNRKNTPFFDSTDRELDLADTLMSFYEGTSRKVYMSLQSRSKKWISWNETNLEKVESLIRYDLEHDGYSVRIKRLGDVGSPCAQAFVWKLSIGTRDEDAGESENRIQNPKRFRKARNDASISSMQATIEKQLDLPKGSVRLVNPSGKKVRANATIRKLRANWAKK